METCKDGPACLVAELLWDAAVCTGKVACQLCQPYTASAAFVTALIHADLNKVIDEYTCDKLVNTSTVISQFAIQAV